MLLPTSDPKYMKAKILLIALFFALLTAGTNASAQCSMCKATVKNNVETGQGQGQGLNKGILYLMSFPYIAGGVIAFFWYRQSRRNTGRLNMLEDVRKKFSGQK